MSRINYQTLTPNNINKYLRQPGSFCLCLDKLPLYIAQTPDLGKELTTLYKAKLDPLYRKIRQQNTIKTDTKKMKQLCLYAYIAAYRERITFYIFEEVIPDKEIELQFFIDMLMPEFNENTKTEYNYFDISPID